METIEKAYAKLNLTLDILGKRPDGYHNMSMIMQTIDLCDNITVTVRRGAGISISSDRPYVPNGRDNLAYRAAEMFLKRSGIADVSVSIKLEKNIPVCSGMAGGSADAAATLRALNRMLGTGFDAETLRRIGRGIGSDVAFCVEGGTALATGRGDDIRQLAPIPDCRFVVLKPSFSISTPKLFSVMDNVRVNLRPDIDGAIAALGSGDLNGLARRCFNVFEGALSSRKRETIEELEDELLTRGALCAGMTGTGSAVYGIFDSEKAARTAYDAIYDGVPEKFIAAPARALTIG